jgi:hypothetical protein
MAMRVHVYGDQGESDELVRSLAEEIKELVGDYAAVSIRDEGGDQEIEVDQEDDQV